WHNPTHAGGLPIKSDCVWSQYFEQERVDIPVPSYRSVFILDNLAPFKHTYLLALQPCLFTNLGVSLFIRRYTRFKKATNPCPAIVVAAYTLAPLHNQ